MFSRPTSFFVGSVILIGSIEMGFKYTDNRTYKWIQEDGSHILTIRCKARHYIDFKFRYFILTSYGAQAARGLGVHSPRRLTPCSVLSHKEKRYIHRTLLYEPLQALDVQNNPVTLLSFQPRETPKIKWWSTSTKEMHQK